MRPVARAEDGRADVHGRRAGGRPHARHFHELAGLGVDVGPDVDVPREPLGGEELAVGAIEREVEAGLLRLEGDRNLLSAARDRQQQMLVRSVEIPRVVGMVLPEPLDGAGLHVEGQHRVRVQVVALSQIGVPRSRVADAEVGELALGIIGGSEPDGAAAVLPGFARPRVGAGLAGRRDRVGAPQFLAAVGIERGDESAIAHLARSTGADQDLSVGGQRGHGEEVTVLVVGHHALPHDRAGPGVEGDDARIEGAEIHAVLVKCRATIHGQDLDQAGEIFRQLGLVLPEHAPGGGIDRVGAIDLLAERRGDDDGAVVDERRGLLVAGLPEGQHPLRGQALDVLRGDLSERAVTPTAIAAVVRQPVLGFFVGIQQSLIGDVGPVRSAGEHRHQDRGPHDEREHDRSEARPHGRSPSLRAVGLASTTARPPHLLRPRCADARAVIGALSMPAAVRSRLTRVAPRSSIPAGGGITMTWETPAFVEVKMDAEINSYQDDFDREQDDRF